MSRRHRKRRGPVEPIATPDSPPPDATADQDQPITSTGATTAVLEPDEDSPIAENGEAQTFTLANLDPPLTYDQQLERLAGRRLCRSKGAIEAIKGTNGSAGNGLCALTRLRKRLFLESFLKHGLATLACRAAGITRGAYLYWAKTDTAFAERIEHCRHEANESLEADAQMRARLGVEENVYHKGRVVGRRRVYSDMLLMALLNANMPEKYRRNWQQTGEGAGESANLDDLIASYRAGRAKGIGEVVEAIDDRLAATDGTDGLVALPDAPSDTVRQLQAQAKQLPGPTPVPIECTVVDQDQSVDLAAQLAEVRAENERLRAELEKLK